MVRIFGTILSVLAGMAFGRALNFCLGRWCASRFRNSTLMRWRTPLVECAVGAVWGVLAWRLMDLLILVCRRYEEPLPYLNVVYTSGIMLFCLALVGIAMLDADHFVLSDFVT